MIKNITTILTNRLFTLRIGNKQVYISLLKCIISFNNRNYKVTVKKCDLILYVTNNAFTPTGKGTFGVLPNKQ